MFQFDYIRPAAVDEACAALADGGKASRVIAGGTDLMVQMHERDKRWKDLDQVVGKDIIITDNGSAGG